MLGVAAHPGGAAFATSSSDARVRLWDLATRTCVQTMGEHTDQVAVEEGVWRQGQELGGSLLCGVSRVVTLLSLGFSAYPELSPYKAPCLSHHSILPRYGRLRSTATARALRAAVTTNC